MRITVVVCTYNRSRSLAKALCSVADLRLPEAVDWEVLVVDNNSCDETREVVESFCRQYPHRFRYIFESRQGKSHALNAGIEKSRGEIVAFMDDDVTVEPTWLQHLTGALHNHEWGGAGGRILPEGTFEPPRWFAVDRPYMLAPFALFDLGPEPGELPEPPFGTNMAFRKAMFQKYGGFRTDLGPRPGSEIRGEDTEFGRRLMDAGERLRYEPSAVVYHPLSKERLTRQYLLAWWFDKGRANIREFGVRPGTRLYCRGIPLYMFRNVAVGTLRWIFEINTGRRFYYKLGVWGKVGEIVECHDRSRGTKRGCGLERGASLKAEPTE